ncbi:hypothetical protein BKK49_04855 [Rodentibacter rarus]|uniref:hypothetical protein n=1 Tax=Rodentibacter rarus TaxID=1908260 RepID=UPI00098529B4|nr:hypothetical protein [Rodentibacter rarus]OOF41471.1 hypothetical protein BKK49_04855 [Rodentibacter rarus]
MGLFSSFCSSVGSAFSSVVDTVSSAASSAWDTVKEVGSKVWEGAKNVAKKVLDTCVDVGEKVVGAAKKVVKTVKKVIKKVAPVVKTVARIAAETIGVKYPWIAVAAKTIIKGIEYLEKLADSPFVKKILNYIEWALEKAKQIRDVLFGKAEQKEAEQRQKELQQAMDMMKTEEQKRAIRFAMLINSYILVRTRIEETLENFDLLSEEASFDHYLRLRATQRLLHFTEKRLQRAKDITQVTSDDLFLVEIGAELLAENPTLSTDDALRLDRISRQYFGKGLLPFVFEELLASWNMKLEEMQETWNEINREYAKIKRELTSLSTKKKIQKLSFEEEVKLTELTSEERTTKAELRYQGIENRNMQNYVYAAEGFLQVLEKTQDQWSEDDQEWILEDSQEVGLLLIQCIESGVHWDELSDEQQSLIEDFANIFAEDSKIRTQEIKKEMLEEYNEYNQLVEVTA